MIVDWILWTFFGALVTRYVFEYRREILRILSTNICTTVIQNAGKAAISTLTKSWV